MPRAVPPIPPITSEELLVADSVSCGLRMATGVWCSVGVSKHNNSYGYPAGGERNDDNRK
jgi:hypothetical protein